MDNSIMSITDKLNDLKIAKQDIKSAIQEKGVTPTGGLSTYADAIRDIQTGGGNVKLSPNTMFGGSHTITYIPNMDTSEYTTMYGMFSECYQLKNVPLFDTRNVTSMGFMFEECNSLQSVPLFDTRNVTSMRGMFSMRPYDIIYPYIPESQLVSVPQFDTSKVTDMVFMFQYCVNLQSVPQFDTSKVTDMAYMFYNCRNLETIPQFDTGNATDMSALFYNCSNLTNLGGFKNLSANLDLYSCYKLTHESLMNVINNLAIVESTKTLKLNSLSIEKLSANDITIAIDKGWTITTA